jgi:hypothetical protein
VPSHQAKTPQHSSLCALFTLFWFLSATVSSSHLRAWTPLPWTKMVSFGLPCLVALRLPFTGQASGHFLKQPRHEPKQASLFSGEPKIYGGC